MLANQPLGEVADSVRATDVQQRTEDAANRSLFVLKPAVPIAKLIGLDHKARIQTLARRSVDQRLWVHQDAMMYLW